MREHLFPLIFCFALAACGSETDTGSSAFVEDVSTPDTHEMSVQSIWPNLQSPIPENLEMEARISAIVSKMTLEEKVGQILQPEIQFITPEEAREYHIGSILNGGGSHPGKNKYASIEDWVALADSFYLASMDDSDGGQAIPIIWGSDAVHGHNNVIGATLFPHNIGLGAANNPDLIEEIGAITAKELLATGIDWTFAPTLAVAQNDGWGRTYESYSEDPKIVASYASAIIRGLQGEPGTEEFLDDYHVVATAKHFLADGGTIDGIDQGDTVATEQELHDIHAAGYEPALQMGVQTAMASFSSWNGQKMHSNKRLITDVLKGNYDLDGFVVGDWNAHGQIPGCSNSSCPEAFNAGVDLFMVPEHWKALYENTITQVEDGTIPMERLDDAVRRILRVKMRAGLFQKGLPSQRPLAGDISIIGHPDHRAVARQAVRESLVLLKNDKGVLPLTPTMNILVAGDGADNIGKQSGGWTISWQGDGNTNDDFPGGTSILDGIKSVVEAAGGQVSFSATGHYESKPDVAIVVFGEDPYSEGHGNRPHLAYQKLGGVEIDLLRRLKSDGVKVVSVFLSGRPMWVNPEINASDAFVAAWLPGSEGSGVSDVLFRKPNGDINFDFKGRLSFSWPKDGQLRQLNPHHPNYDPLFELGYGLSYQVPTIEMAELSEDAELVIGESETRSIFDRRPGDGFRLIAGIDGTSNEDLVTVSGALTQVEGGELVISTEDKDVQEDARRVDWKTDKKLFVGAELGVPTDFSRYENGVLSFEIKVNERPSEKVELSMFSVTTYSNSQLVNLDITDELKAVPMGEWRTISVPFSCFLDKGIDRENVISPFSLSTSGLLSISFASVALTAEKEGRDPIDCTR